MHILRCLWDRALLLLSRSMVGGALNINLARGSTLGTTGEAFASWLMILRRRVGLSLHWARHLGRGLCRRKRIARSS